MKRFFNRIAVYFGKRTVPYHILGTILWVWVLSLAAMLVWGISISFMDGFEYSLDPMKLLPDAKNIMFSNYLKAFTAIEYTIQGHKVTFVKMILNTIWYAFGVTILRIIATTLAAYCVSKVKFKGRLIVYYIVLFQMLLPSYGSDVSYLLIIRQLGLYNTPGMLLANFAGHGSWFLLMYGCFRGISDSYGEAARIDGASEFTVFFKVMLPFAKGMITAMLILLLISTWNDYQTPLLHLPSYPTLSTGLFRYKTIAGYTLDVPIYFAGLLITSIPVVTVFIIFNKTLMENMTIGGLKA